MDVPAFPIRTLDPHPSIGTDRRDLVIVQAALDRKVHLALGAGRVCISPPHFDIQFGLRESGSERQGLDPANRVVICVHPRTLPMIVWQVAVSERTVRGNVEASICPGCD